MLIFIAFMEEREYVERLGRMDNGLVSTFHFLHSSNGEKPFFNHNKGFLNYAFCRDWAVRNPAGTRIASHA